MSSSPSTFPWHYYIRSVRSRIFLIIITVLICYVEAKVAPGDLLRNYFFIIIIVSLVTFIVAVFRIQPFMRLLGRIEKIQVKLPHDKKLDIIYQKNEWKLIHEMLSLTEEYINEQAEYLQNQSIQSDTMLESIPNEIVIIDNFQNLIRYNQQFKQKFIEEKDTSVVKDEKLWKIFENQEILGSFSAAIQYDQCFRLPAVGFEKLNEFYDIAITPIRDANNKVTGALGIFHNVTALKLTEQMRVDFVANVSHEIRTPLTSIKGYSQLLAAQQTDLSDDQRKVIDKIVSNTERLKDLFDNLLKLSVIESQYNVTKEDIAIESLLQKIEVSLKGKYMNKTFEFKKNIQIDFLKGDSKLLEQVFTNLIDNAIKYSKKDICIDIDIKDVDNQSVITIRDDGPGIHEDQLKRIFERFYRVQGQSSQLVEGSGLGLSIVKHIINKHQGEISVDSTVDIGTTFTIKLPN